LATEREKNNVVEEIVLFLIYYKHCTFIVYLIHCSIIWKDTKI